VDLEALADGMAIVLKSVKTNGTDLNAAMAGLIARTKATSVR
jgi:hypothetical protein